MGPWRGWVIGAVVGALTAAVLAIGDYNHNPPCALVLRPCLRNADCRASCPGPDVHWLLIGSIGLATALVLGAFLTFSLRARAGHSLRE